MIMKKKRYKRDIEKNYPAKQFVKKLRRLADCIEHGQKFQIQVAGERVSIPPLPLSTSNMSGKAHPRSWNSSSNGHLISHRASVRQRVHHEN